MRRCWYYFSFLWFNVKINWASCSGTSWSGYWLWDYRCTVFTSIRYQSWSCKSIAKTSRLLVIDEDVPGGASAYILQQIIEQQNGYNYLDSKPQTLTSKAHRPSYGTDGDYFSKPSAEDIFEKVYAMMNEVDPSKFLIYIKTRW
jgi:hypothetical protein